MKACHCTLGGTKACQGCSNNYEFDDGGFPYDGKVDYTGFLRQQLEQTGKDIDPQITKLINTNFWDLIR